MWVESIIAECDGDRQPQVGVNGAGGGEAEAADDVGRDNEAADAGDGAE